jgi:NAD(P)-dependent dehydrogenase (short-subunit alcohol dehydrogenase family)
MSLIDKVSVITGGASGIGRAVALEFAKEGNKHPTQHDSKLLKLEQEKII